MEPLVSEAGGVPETDDNPDGVFRVRFQQYGPLVYGIARRVVVDPDLAADVAQQVFIELWRDPQRFQTRVPLRVSLATVAHSRAVDVVRREQRFRDRHHEVWSQRSEHGNDVGEQVTDDRAAADRRDAVLRAVASLPANHRRAIEAAYYEGHTYREVAVLLGVPEGTVKAWIRAALRRLGVMLAPFRYEPL